MRRLSLMLLSALLAIMVTAPVYARAEFDDVYRYRSSYSERYETYDPRPVERHTHHRYYYRDTERLEPEYREYRHYYHEPDNRGLRLDVPFFSFRLG